MEQMETTPRLDGCSFGVGGVPFGGKLRASMEQMETAQRLAGCSMEGGVALVAPLRLRIREDRFREPDLMLLRDATDPRRQDRYWLGADLVAEVVSPDDPDRDYGRKRMDYAEAGIPEYWIVDPRRPEITVLTLGQDGYIDREPFGVGDIAASSLLNGFSVAVSAVFESRTAS